MAKELPSSMKALITEVEESFAGDQKIQALFRSCFSNAYETTMRPQKDGTTFVITGDIPAMWLRDSAAQVRPYLILAEHDEDMADLIEGVIKKQFHLINHDPYANAFNEVPNGNRYHEDQTEMTPLIWERKYEIDSLCYPIQLSYLFWKATGRTAHFNNSFRKAVKSILDTWETEQNHEGKSGYKFVRDNCPPQDTLSHGGYGAPVGYTGMTWCGFRPSDDTCKYGYLIPSNMFAVVVLRQLSTIAMEILDDSELAANASKLEQEINRGVQSFGTVQHPKYGTIYAYETDGLGRYNLMDDANVPSLLSLPYLGYCRVDDPIYQNTRKFLLSNHNPYYYQGKVASGIGSPHTPNNYIWHISLAIQGLTATTKKEQHKIMELFKQTDANTNFMHEGFHVDDPNQYTRAWFSWANSIFSEFTLSQCNRFVKGSPLAP